LLLLLLFLGFIACFILLVIAPLTINFDNSALYWLWYRAAADAVL